ncbi:mechanosensitive ion channel protein MscS [Cellulomonas sp. WB94]|nr:mechanosensitive ion channel protein MscS [Cellulomonas sp. WB94]
MSSAPSAADPSPSPSSSGLTQAELVDHANAFGRWFLGTGVRLAVILLVGALTLLVLRVVIRSVTQHIVEGADDTGSSLLRRVGPLASARRVQRARTVGSVLRSTATIVVGTLVFLLVLDTVGMNIAPFIASAGIVGVAVGFGAQSLVKDFLSGVFMLLEDQYGVGDVVDVGPGAGTVGTVEAVGLRVTKIRDSAGTLWYVPNGTMTRVGNKTQGWAKAVVEVSVDYFADLDEVRALLTEAAERVAADPVIGTYLQGAPTVTGIEDVTFDAVTLRLSVTTAPAMQWDVARELRVAVRDALTRAGIPLGGQRDLLAAERERAASPSGAPARALPPDVPAGQSDED